MASITNRSERFEYTLLLVPAVVFFAIFIVYPVFGGVFYSLTDWDGINLDYHFIGLDNFRTLSTDFVVLIPLMNTFIFAFLLTIFQNILSLAIAVAINRRFFTRDLLRTLFFVPVVLSPLIVGYIWGFLFTEPIAHLGKLLDIQFLANNATGSRQAALLSGVFVGVWRMAGWTMIIYIAALQGVPIELHDAATVDGASGWRKFWSVVFPLIAPALTINMVMTMERGFKEFDLMFALTGGGPGNASELISLTIYNESFQFFRAAYGTAMGVVLFLIIVVLSFIQVVLFRKNEERMS
jgi:raffinose/stachyose/melibiose transport system permease protein